MSKMPVHRVVFYETAAKRCLLRDKLERGKIPGEVEDLLIEKVRLLKERGWENSVKCELVKQLAKDVFELRVNASGSLGYRFFCFYVEFNGHGYVVLVDAHVKSNIKDAILKIYINRVKRARKDWVMRNQGGIHGR